MSRIGQLFMTGVSGKALTQEEKSFIENEDIGGVILFANNYENPAQLAELVNSIQALRKEYPLFIATDHEGGRVIRFKNHFTQFPPMLEIAKLNSPKIVYNIAKIMADELSACGVNLNLSPVCDVFNNPANKVIGDRAFGTDEEEVSKYVSSVIRGLQTNGVMSCAKHFPGHGCTTKDSHYDLPIVKKTRKELEECEFVPFVKAIKSRVHFVMMAHLIVDAIDDELPCTLSAKAYNILRSDFKFNKIIISDDMQMKAITDKFSHEKAAIMAIEAGADLLEYRDFSEMVKAYEGFKKHYKTKKVSKELIEEKIKRIDAVKKECIKEYNPIYIPDIEKKVNTGQSKALINEIQEMIKAQNS